MRNSLFGVLQALSTLLTLLVTRTDSSEPGDCNVIVRRSCELTWSTDLQTFVASSLEDKDLDSPPRQTDFDKNNASLSQTVWCVKAPEGYRVAVQVTVKPTINEPTSKNCGSTLSCESSCLAIYEARAMNVARDEFSTNSSQIFVEFFKENNLSSHILLRVNSSKFDENIERYPRQLVSSRPPIALNRTWTRQRQFNKSPINMSPRPRIVLNRSWRRQRQFNKCKPCKKKTARRRSKRKRKLIKDIAAELLLEIQKTAERVSNEAKNISFSQALSRNKAFKFTRNRLNRLLNLDRRRKFTTPRPVTSEPDGRPQQYPSNTRRSAYVTQTQFVSNEYNERRDRDKRDARNSATENPPSKYYNRQFTLCGPRVNISESSAEYTSPENEEFFGEKRHKIDDLYMFNATSDWAMLKFPLQLLSDGPELRVNLQSELAAGDALLQSIVLRINFEPSETSNRDAYYENTNVTPTNTRETRAPLPTNSDNKTRRHSPASSQGQGVRFSKHNDLRIAVGVGGGLCLAGIFVGVCLFLLCRTRRRHLSKKTSQTVTDEGESEKCLSAIESGDERLSYTSIKEGNDQHRIGKQMAQESEISMLEHKTHTKRGRSTPGRTTRPNDKTSTNRDRLQDSSQHRHHHHRQSQHGSKCKHAQTARGTSRHDNCIVCHIAGNPHQPIKAQYASEFLPPASRTQSGFNSTLPSSHDNFDKFNRMQNNPYRNSPRLSPKSDSLPWTVKLPDGEERCKGRDEHKSSMALEERSYPICVKPPPNRTVFGSASLPYTSESDSRKFNPNGYPGPPTSSRSPTLRDCNSNHHSVEYHNPRTSEGSDCYMCRHILNHIGEPPPEYSDVVRLEARRDDTESHAICVSNTQDVET